MPSQAPSSAVKVDGIARGRDRRGAQVSPAAEPTRPAPLRIAVIQVHRWHIGCVGGQTPSRCRWRTALPSASGRCLRNRRRHRSPLHLGEIDAAPARRCGRPSSPGSGHRSLRPLPALLLKAAFTSRASRPAANAVCRPSSSCLARWREIGGGALEAAVESPEAVAGSIRGCSGNAKLSP